MKTPTAFVDIFLDDKINRHYARLVAGDALDVFGLDFENGDTVICACLFDDEPLQLPGGKHLKLLNRISLTESFDSSNHGLCMYRNNAGRIVMSLHAFSVIITDTRSIINEYFVSVVAQIIPGCTHMRLRNVSSDFLTEMIPIPHDDLDNQSIVFNQNAAIVLVETFQDTHMVGKTVCDSLNHSETCNLDEVCALVPRETNFREIRQILCQDRIPGKAIRDCGFAFPVKITDENRINDRGIWIRDESLAKRDIHYSAQSRNPIDAIILRDGYDFYHYEVDGYNDVGWGCAYRAIQTLSSWFVNIFNSFKNVPTIEEMQGVLKRVDYAHSSIRIGSHTWIGCVEASTVLSELSGGRIVCKIHYADSSQVLAEFLRNEGREHLLKVGSPIMVGAGDYAFVIGGISANTSTALILDPHYTGRSNIKACSWKAIENFFDFKKIGGDFVNICLPSPL